MKKEELGLYVKTKAEIEQIKEKLAEIEEIYTQARAVKTDGMPKGSPIIDRIGESIAKIEELRVFYAAKISEMMELQLKIERIIEGLEGEERILMRKRYLDGLKWEEICEEICCSWKTAHRIHKRILEKIKDDIE